MKCKHYKHYSHKKVTGGRRGINILQTLTCSHTIYLFTHTFHHHVGFFKLNARWYCFNTWKTFRVIIWEMQFWIDTFFKYQIRQSNIDCIGLQKTVPCLADKMQRKVFLKRTNHQSCLRRHRFKFSFLIDRQAWFCTHIRYCSKICDSSLYTSLDAIIKF